MALNDVIATQIMGELDDLTRKIDDLNIAIAQKIEALPGLADTEMKRAGQAAITSLSKEVGNIAKEIAGDAAKADRNKTDIEIHEAKRKLIYTCTGAFIVSAIIFCGTGIFFQNGMHARALSEARDLVDEANKSSEKATADLTAYKAVADKNAATEIEKIRSTSGWAGTPDGRLAKQFFDLPSGGLVAAKCTSKEWDIIYVGGEKICHPKMRNIIIKDDIIGWRIP